MTVAAVISAVAAVAYLAVTGLSIRDLYRSCKQVIQVKEEGLVTVQSLQPVLTPVTPIAGKTGCGKIAENAEGALDAEDVAKDSVRVAKDTAKVGVKIAKGGLVTGAVGGLVLGAAAGQVAETVGAAALDSVKAQAVSVASWGVGGAEGAGGALAKIAEGVGGYAAAVGVGGGVVALGQGGGEILGLLTGAAGGAVVGAVALTGALTVAAAGLVIAGGALLFARAVAVEAAQTAVEAAKLGLEFAQATQALNADQDWEPVVGKAKAWRVPGGW